MKIILDTNIYIAAALGNSDAAAILNGDFKIFISHQIFNELKQVIKRDKFKLSNEDKIKFIDELMPKVKFIKTDSKIKFNRDRDDSKFLDLCNEIEADYLITNDYQLLKGTHLTKTKIIDLKEFNNILDSKS